MINFAYPVALRQPVAVKGRGCQIPNIECNEHSIRQISKAKGYNWNRNLILAKRKRNTVNHIDPYL